MAKTLVTLTEETILANIDAPKLKEAFSTCAAVARKQTSVGALDAKCADIRDLWEFADTLEDLAKAIHECVRNAEGIHYAEAQCVTDGLRLKNTGSTVTIKDLAKFFETAEMNGCNLDTLRAAMKLSATDAQKAVGYDRERFLAEFADCLEIHKKADSLQRA